MMAFLFLVVAGCLAFYLIRRRLRSLPFRFAWSCFRRSRS